MTVPELCVYTHNFFDRADDPVAGEFAFEPDTVPVGVVPGQYFLVCGSIFNDGVHKAGDGDLVAEIFTGTVQPMRVPHDFVALAALRMDGEEDMTVRDEWRLALAGSAGEGLT